MSVVRFPTSQARSYRVGARADAPARWSPVQSAAFVITASAGLWAAFLLAWMMLR